VATPSVFVIAKSARGLRVSVSVAVLSVVTESVVPTGAVIVAVLASEPVANEATVAVRVYVAVAPTARLMVSVMLPVPDAAHVAPAVATQDQVAELNEAGNVSAISAPTTAEGPLFEATMV
jgi:hypothetical protein